jgi:hypothetical protein
LLLLQVIVGSFMYAGSKKKTVKKGKVEREDEVGTKEANDGEEGKEETPPPVMMMLPMQIAREEEELASPDDAMMGGSRWTGMMRQMESRSWNIDINSIRE